MQSIIKIQFDHDNWFEEENALDFLELFKENIQEDGTISDGDIIKISNNFEGTRVTKTEVVTYLNNWNKSIKAFMVEGGQMGYIDLNRLGDIA